MLKQLEALDRSATLWINGLGTVSTDPFWHFMSNSKVWIPLYLAIIALLFWKLGWKRALVMIAAIVLADVCADQLCNLVKNSACRLRPCCDQAMIDSGLRVLQTASKNHIYGFFSAHAATCFALAAGSSLALIWAMKDRNTKANKLIRIIYSCFILLWASMVGLSRIMVAKHFLGDVIVGTFAGIILAYIFCYIAKRIISRFSL